MTLYWLQVGWKSVPKSSLSMSVVNKWLHNENLYWSSSRKNMQDLDRERARGRASQIGSINVSSISLPRVFLNKSICSAFSVIYQVIFYSPNVKFCQSSDLPQVCHSHFWFPLNPSDSILIVSNNVSFKIWGQKKKKKKKIWGNFTVVKIQGQSGKCTSLLFCGFEVSFV